MPSHKDTIIITCANNSLGYGLISKINSTPQLAGYYKLCLTSTTTSVKQTFGKSSRLCSCDIISMNLSSLSNIREVAKQINSRIAVNEIPPIRILILNTAYYDIDCEVHTENGLYPAFVMGYLGPWLLSMLLLQSMDRVNGRIVVANDGLYHTDAALRIVERQHVDEQWNNFFNEDNIDDFTRGTYADKEDGIDGAAELRRYGAFKLFPTMMVGELQLRLEVDPVLNGISITAIDLGNIGDSGLARRSRCFTRATLSTAVPRCLASFISRRCPKSAIRAIVKSSSDVIQAALQTRSEVRGSSICGLKLQLTVHKDISAAERAMIWRETVRYSRLTREETALTWLS
ncbi:putative short-chain dehydrogenase [Xylaria arbuscula]|nr:putative short-chain dehydrogenase [Xylaria arbuscula]